jgi:hypothetical protein
MIKRNLDLPAEYLSAFKEFERSTREIERTFKSLGLFETSSAFSKAADMALQMQPPAFKFLEDDQRRIAKIVELAGAPSRGAHADSAFMGSSGDLLQTMAAKLNGLSAALQPLGVAYKAAVDAGTRLTAGPSNVHALDLMGAEYKAALVPGTHLATMLSMTHALEAACLTKFELARLPELGPHVEDWSAAVSGLDEMLLAQKELFRSFDSSGGFSLPPSLVIDWPPRSVLSHAAVLNRLFEPGVPPPEATAREELEAARRDELVEETEKQLLAVLEAYPALRDEWLSARAILKSNIGRRARYFCVSIRQLLKSVLDTVAPLDVVTPWVNANDSRQETTAKSRFLCVASMYPSDQFGAFVVKDSEEMFKVWDIASKKVHQSEPSDETLKDLEWRAAVWLIGVLTLSRGRGN